MKVWRQVLTHLGAALLFAGAAAADPLAHRFGGPFSLTAHDGKRVSDADFRGRHLLVYFGFTQCVDLCPVDVPNIAAALDKLGQDGERVQPLFITVDPANDTPAKLAEYVTAFHPRLIGLTGKEEELQPVLRSYRVHRMRIPNTPEQQKTTGHTHAVDHGSLIYLMGPDGKFLTLLPHGSTSERIAEVVRRHLP